jgi:hypothetical protein
MESTAWIFPLFRNSERLAENIQRKNLANALSKWKNWQLI